MGKTSKKKRKEKEKEQKRDLAQRLRGFGLRKELAKRIADNAVNARGQLPGTARKTIKEIRAKVDDLGKGAVRTTKAGAQDGEHFDADADAAAEQQRQKQKKASAKKAKKVKKKLIKKAKQARKAAKAKAKAKQAKTAE